jgi:broad specificity phosphatase PhoE
MSATAPGAAAPEAPRVVVLVRHCEKAATPAADPPLSDAGARRAEALANALADARVDAIVTTRVRRTRDTARPLADKLGLTPIVVDAPDDIAAHVRDVAAVVRHQPPGSLVLVVGHSNTIPAIIQALGGPQLADLCDSSYARLFTLVLVPDGPARLVQSTYGAPDPPPAPGCTGTGMHP